MSSHALEVLEFERVLEKVAHYASSDPGRTRILALRPVSDFSAVQLELRRVSDVMRFVAGDPNWSLGGVPDVASELAQLAVDGAVLDPIGAHRLGVLLTTSRLLAKEFGARGRDFPSLESIVARLIERPDLERTIAKSVDDEGRVLDSASRELKQIRDRLRGAHSKVVRRLETYLGDVSERYLVPDSSVTIREGRYVIPVRREGRREVGGIVHGESQTGATLFIEPPVAIEAMNLLRDLERDEAREIRRVLGELTAALAPDAYALRGVLDALADFDSLRARARAAEAWDAHVPDVVSPPESGMRVVGGRHPLLASAAGEEVVPFDLYLTDDERCLVVSGPNTGGKSVFLKAVGLVAAMTQSGIVPPVGSGTRLPVFSSFFADIGDEQSIARNLSTFSAHLANLSDIVDAADGRSLVLIDEMGTGTDPAEGAALAQAVLEELVERGATTLVSSHLGDLKRLDSDGSGIVNASLQFDEARMEPTYRLVKGRPGRSYGLAIARRLGFSGGVLDRAEEYRAGGAADVEEVLARLEQQEQAAEALVVELDRERALTQSLRSDLENRQAALSEAERTAEDDARQEARTLLMTARAEVEETIAELRAAFEAGLSLEEAEREARSRVERAARRQADRANAGSATAFPSVDVEEGDRVRIRATGAAGYVIEVRDRRALVEVGSLRIEVPLHEVQPTEAGHAAKPRGGGWSGPAGGTARTEVHVRGLRVDEMERELELALDAAVLEDLPGLRIVHGKGTGALRKRVGEILGVDARVKSFRMGEAGEGGAGVTVVSFRS